MLALAGVNCGTTGLPEDPSDMTPIVAPIQIDVVTVALAESFPVQAFSHVRGTVGDGCTNLLPIEQRRSGNRVFVEIKARRPKDAICTQVAKLFDENIALGSFTPGDYELHVNDVVRHFNVD
jgi:inhibitor of cysteine peptidase